MSVNNQMSHKTALIYNQFAYGLTFHLLEGNYKHLDGILINSREEEELQVELSNLIFDKEANFKYKVTPEEFEQGVRDGAKIVICGFIP